MKNNRIVFQIRDRVQSNVMWMCCTQIYMGSCLKTQSTKMQCTNGCTRRLWEFNCIYSHVTSERSKLVMFVMYATSLCVQHILYGIFPIQEIFYTHVRFYSLWETVSEKKSIYFGTSVFGTKHLMSTVWILSSTLRCIVCACVCYFEKLSFTATNATPLTQLIVINRLTQGFGFQTGPIFLSWNFFIG